MALTEEQRAMLQLLLEGGQGYDDIASLLGTTSDEVRSRSRDALREMGGADPDSTVQLSDYLLGQADPIGRADAVRHLQNDPEANALASRLVSQLRLLAPKSQLPEIPAPKGGRAAPAPAAPGAPASDAPGGGGRAGRAVGRISETVRGAGSNKRSSQIIAISIGAVILLVVGVLAIAGVFGGGDGDGDDDGTQTAASDDLTIVDLAPVTPGTGGAGQAVFAQAQDQPLLQTNLTGLAPTSGDNIYIVWLYSSDRAAFPLARDKVGEDGNLTGAAAIPTEIIPLLGQFGCIDVSLASTSETQEALQQAVQGQGLPRHTGETVLRGQIPAAPGESAPTGADAECAVAAAQAGGGGQGGAAQP
jgi:hypothetical protein